MKKSFCWAIWEGKRRLSAWNLHLETLSCPTMTPNKQMPVLFTPHWVVFTERAQHWSHCDQGSFTPGSAEQGRAVTAPGLQIYTFCKAFGIAHYSEWNCPFFLARIPHWFHGVHLFSTSVHLQMCFSPGFMDLELEGYISNFHEEKKNSTVLNFSLRSVAVNSWFICQTSFNSITEEKKHLRGAGTENNYLFSSTHEVFIIKSSSSVYSKQQKCQWIL